MKFEDEQCPWTSDDLRWSFTKNSVVATVSRQVNAFKPINLQKFRLKGGYTVTTPTQVAARTGEEASASDERSDYIDFVVEGAIVAGIYLALLVGVMSFLM